MVTSTLLGPDGQPIAKPVAKPIARLPGQSYRGTSQSSFELAEFRAPHISAKTANRFSRQTLADRARDITRNESLAATALRKSTAMGVGSGWTLQSRPDAVGLGIDADQARDLGRQIERVFSRWGTQVGHWNHARRQLDFGGWLRLMWGEMQTVNEVLAVLIHRPDAPGAYLPTGLQEVDTDRLSTPTARIDDEYLSDGIEMDDYGAATHYHIRRAHPSDPRFDGASLIWDRIPRETEYGRPVVIHAFRPDRVEQGRGITLFAPLIEKFAMRGRMERTELQSALLNAVFAAFIKTGFDPVATAEMLGIDNYSDQLTSYQDVRASHYKDHAITLNDIQLPILMPGDEIVTNTIGRGASSFEAFNKILTRNIAATLGVADGQISGDYTGLNYSTLRGAYNEIWSDVLIQRADFAAQVVRPIMLAVIDDALRAGRITPPPGCADLFDEPDAWLPSNWVGPARGHIDPEKEAKGDALRLAMNVTTRTDIAASNGRDYEQIVTTLAEERRLEAEAGLDTRLPDAALSPSNPGNRD